MMYWVWMGLGCSFWERMAIFGVESFHLGYVRTADRQMDVQIMRTAVLDSVA